jgi:cytochrome c peroxidase
MLGFRSLVLLLAVLSLSYSWGQAVSHELRLKCHSGGQPLILNQPAAAQDAAGRELTLTRVDLLLSGLQLQRRDGSWLSLPQWHGFFRGGAASPAVALPELPAETFRAIRLNLGVGPEVNHADPAQLPADHALHPVTSGMHWGWATGYIFLALEGRWQQDNAPAGILGGFSYHLGNDPNLIPLELPLQWDAAEPSILTLELDLAHVLAGIDVSADGDSTHSRKEDRVVQTLRQRIPQALKASLQYALPRSDQPLPLSSAQPSAALQPYPFQLTAQMPQVALPQDNLPTVQGVELGKALFHDKRFSRDSSLSCASCHDAQSAFSDAGKRFSLGVAGSTGKRNAMPLFNLAWAKEFFWDGRAKSLREQALMPIQDAHEMAQELPTLVQKLSADESLRSAFSQVFGTAEITAERIGLAMEQFMLTLLSQDSKFDRVQRGAAEFTAQEMRGFQLFLTEHDPFRGLRGADCFHCHGGPLFTNHQFINIGLPGNTDPGRYAVTHDPADEGKFRTPSLRNIAVTAPYMHDGRFQTLEEVVDHYDHGVVKGKTLDPNLAKHPDSGMKLSAEEKAALVAFLRTLTDEAFIGQHQPTAAR